MKNIVFLHNNQNYEFRVGQPCEDGLYLQVDKTFVLVDITSELQSIINNKLLTYDLDNYANLRKKEYDKLNQLEMQFDDFVNGTSTWIDAINAIKTQYPKPNEQ